MSVQDRELLDGQPQTTVARDQDGKLVGAHLLVRDRHTHTPPPTAAPAAYPMLPYTACVETFEPCGSVVMLKTNWELPVSVTTRSLGLI